MDAIENQVGSVNLNSVEGNPYQQDFNYHGFTASPVGGTPIGVAVYQEGVRVNEGFGDTVNWDLIPTFAIKSLNLTSANPVFGLNALGGAVALGLNDGFNFDGLTAEMSGGSYGRHTELAQYGVTDGNWGFYVGANASDEAGWRINMPSHVRQLYADAGYHGANFAIHLSYTVADNTLIGTGPTAVNLLAYNYGSGIDYPGNITNTLNMVTLKGSYYLTDDWTFDALVYYRGYTQYNINAAPTSSIPCVAPLNSNTFCSPNPATGAQTQLFNAQTGQPVPLSVGGNFPGENDFARTNTTTLGGTLQATSTAKLFGYTNHLIAGTTIVNNGTNYSTGALLGSLDNTRTNVNTVPVNSVGGTDIIVGLHAANTYTSFYATDTLDLSENLFLTASVSYNLAAIDLVGLTSGALNGNDNFHRLNPSGGLTYKINSGVTAFFNYSQDNRVPTPQELECADPSNPCILATSFIADPPLKQVVAKTYEAGLRGGLSIDGDDNLDWSVDLFHAHDFNDIFSVPSDVELHGYYVNSGNTLRQGVDLTTTYHNGPWRVGFDYSLLDATFRSFITLSSPFNPDADANGNIYVRPGDTIPAEPRNRVKLNVDYNVTAAWSVGASANYNSSQFLKGDEANQNAPVPGYAIVGFRSSYTIDEHFQLFGNIDNVMNQKYYSFGTFTTESGLPMPAGVPALNSVRSYGPGAPIGVWAGLRFTY